MGAVAEQGAAPAASPLGAPGPCFPQVTCSPLAVQPSPRSDQNESLKGRSRVISFTVCLVKFFFFKKQQPGPFPNS